jgi:hypothetical protein
MSYGIGPEARVELEAWRKALTDRAGEIEREFNLRCSIVRNDVHIDTVGGGDTRSCALSSGSSASM